MTLDPYADADLAALYDLFYNDHDEDVAMYEGFARRGATPSLELGIGSGRIALRLARGGLDVRGIDPSPHMLARLREALDREPEIAERIGAREGDMRSFDLGERFDLVYCAANTFMHLLTTDDQLATLRCVHAHLRKGGVFVAKIQSPRAVEWSADDAMMRLADTRVDAATGETVMRFMARRAVPAMMRTDVTAAYDSFAGDGTVRRRLATYSLKYTPPDELRLLIDAAGLRLLHLYGDHDLSPYDEGSDSMVFVAGATDG